MESFEITKFKNGSYEVNTSKLFDAFNSLHPKNNSDNFIAENASLNLNVFLKNAKEAFNRNCLLMIDNKEICNANSLLDWFSEYGTEEFQAEMTKRFHAIFSE